MDLSKSNKEKLKDKYYNQGGKEKAREYFSKIKKLLKKKQKLGTKIYLKNKKNQKDNIAESDAKN